jgi:periplasmic protein TonB
VHRDHGRGARAPSRGSHVSSGTAPEWADTTLHSSATDRTLSAGDLSAPVLTRSALPLQSQPAIEPAIFVPIAESGLLGLSLPGVANEDDQYVVRSLLTVPPVPLSPVVIDFPDFKGEANRYVAALTLFIDESGVVVRVKAEGNALPSPLEEAARNAFMRARFRPGELTDLGAVKSRIRVEVVFESGAPRQVG